jgi:hypothetical protein
LKWASLNIAKIFFIRICDYLDLFLSTW